MTPINRIAMAIGLGIAFIVGVVLPFVIITWIISSWNQVQLTPEKAQVLLQELVDTDPSLQGTVRDVSLSGAICSEAVGGNSCRVDVQFRIDGRLGNGWCTYGVGYRQITACAISGFVDP